MNSLVLFISGCALFTLVLSSPQGKKTVFLKKTIDWKDYQFPFDQVHNYLIRSQLGLEFKFPYSSKERTM